MRDDYLSADWASHHTNVADGFHKFVETIKTSLNWLNAYQYDAPWRNRPHG